MGLQAIPAYIGVAGFQTPVETDRNLIEGIFGRTGVTRYGHFAVTPTASARQVSVAAGSAVLVGAESTTQGAYFVWSDAAETFTFAAASGNPRVDSLILRVIDEQYGADPGGDSRVEIEVVQGVAAASPVARADSYFNTGGGGYKAGAWFRIADIRINLVDGVLPAGQITHNIQYTRNSSARILAPDSAARAAVTDGSLGDILHQLDTNELYRWTGSIWAPFISAPVYAEGANVSTNSLAWTATGSVLSTTFVGPASGKALITVAAWMTNTANAGPWTGSTSYQVTGSGFTTYGPDGLDGAHTNASAANIGSVVEKTSIVTGLIPGVTHTVTMMHQVSGPNAWNFNHRSILIQPCMA